MSKTLRLRMYDINICFKQFQCTNLAKFKMISEITKFQAHPPYTGQIPDHVKMIHICRKFCHQNIPLGAEHPPDIENPPVAV